MNQFHRSLAFTLIAGVCALGLLGMEGFSLQPLKAVGETSYSCADITFGTTEYSSNAGPDVGSFTAHSFTVSSVNATYAYCPSNNVSGSLNDSARIGKSATAGSLTFNFSALRISKIKVLAYEFGSDVKDSKTAVCQVTTSAQTTPQSQNVTATSAPDISDSSTDAGLVFTNLDNGGSTSTWLTIASTAAARFNLCKIVITITNSGSASSSSSAASSTPTSSTPSSIVSSGTGDYAPITFNFVEQGNQYTGDCTYIKAGDNDILIDAGNRTSCATTIETYLEDSSRVGNYVSDGKLEYVIATHAHQDHIAGFVGVSDSSTAGMNGVLYHYSIGTLIDFSRANTTSNIYSNYQTARTYAVNQGAKHFTALQCWNNEGGGAARSYDLGQGLSMQILYNYYYENSSTDENNYSVCVLFTQGSKHFLMTGDLEADGESRLVSNNTLPEVELFKGGHHGSYTANTDALLSVIKPKLVCICACVGNTEYTTATAHSFPAQESIDRIAPYTDRVYCTTLGSSGSDASTYHVPMNGSIRVHYDAASVESLSFTNNDTKLKDTAWFKANRTCPSAWSS
jgi:beta-lactamase superfamily II metal-dependent hydrolase